MVKEKATKKSSKKPLKEKPKTIKRKKVTITAEPTFCSMGKNAEKTVIATKKMKEKNLPAFDANGSFIVDQHHKLPIFKDKKEKTEEYSSKLSAEVKGSYFSEPVLPTKNKSYFFNFINKVKLWFSKIFS